MVEDRSLSNRYFRIQGKMTGGLLQLVARGVDDLFLMGDPEITFFKIVYRRHTNFSIHKSVIRFNNRLDFGQNAELTIPSKGDLLHHLYLEIDLPEIDLRYQSTTKRQLQASLASHGIVWTVPTDELDLLVTEADRDEINGVEGGDAGLIDPFYTTLSDQKTAYETQKGLIEALVPGDYGTVEEFRRAVAEILLASDSDNLDSFVAIDEFSRGDGGAIPAYTHVALATLDQVQKEVVIRLKAFILKDEEAGITDADKADMIANFEFYDRLRRADVAVTRAVEGTLSISIFFKQIMSQLYSDDTDKDYQKTDAYKIFDQYLTSNNQKITDASDIEVIRQELIDNILWGIGKNIQLMSKIFYNFDNSYRFIFYKRYKYDTVNQTFNTGEPFLNVSTSTTTVFDDNFTNNFSLISATDEPSSIEHQYSTDLTTKVNSFHTDNRDVFRTTVFQNYFNNLDLWSSLEISNHLSQAQLDNYATDDVLVDAGISGVDLTNRLDNVYLLNFLPMVVNDEVQNLLNYLIVGYDEVDGAEVPRIPDTDVNYSLAKLRAFMAAKVGAVGDGGDQLATFRNENDAEFDGGLDFVDATDLLNLVKLSKAYKTNDLDSFVVGVFKKYDLLVPKVGYPGAHHIEYLINRWLIRIDEEVGFYNDAAVEDDKLGDKEREVLAGIIGSFKTPLDSFPTYDSYETRMIMFQLTNSLFTNETTFITDQGPRILPPTIYPDATSSVWDYIYQTISTSYQNIFNEQLLDETYFTNSLGQQALYELDEIESEILTLDEGESYDYYSITTETIDDVTDYIELRRKLYRRIKERYDEYNTLMDLAHHAVSERDFHYAKIDSILDNLTTFLEDTYAARESEPLTPPTDAIAIINAMRVGYAGVDPADTYDKIGCEDFFEELRLSAEIVDSFIDTADPRYLNTVGLTPQKLYAEHSRIRHRFGNFTTTEQIINFLLERLVEMSLEIPDASILFDQTDNSTTQSLVVAYLDSKITAVTMHMMHIRTDTVETVKEEVIQAALSNQLARFAWVPRVGHYLIDRITLLIGGQEVGNFTGEWLDIRHSFNRRESKESGYQKMIGDLPSLTTFDRTQKRKTRLRIPLPYWFTLDSGNSLPLVALNYTDIQLQIKTRPLSEVAQWDGDAFFRRKPRISCQLRAEYIFLEPEERKMIVDRRHEYLIDQLQLEPEVEITAASLDEDGYFRHRVYLDNPVKQLIWRFRDARSRTPTGTNGTARWDDYLYHLDGSDPISPYDTLEIEFNRRWREEAKDHIYYNYVIPHKQYRSTPLDGLGAYSFAIDPFSLQPTGSANMSRIDEAFLIFKIKPEVVTEMTDQNLSLKFQLYATSHNILRVMSGMAGLAFFAPS